MKVAMICQPWDPVRPPVTSGSVAIWVYEVCRRLVQRDDCEVTVYAQHAPGDLEHERHEGVEYRRFPLGRTGRAARLKHRIFDRPLKRRPFFSSRFFCSDFINAVARDIRERQFDIVHIQNYSQFVTTIRRLNPDVRIILHMRCEWLLQLDRRMLVNRIRQADLVVSVGKYLTNATIQRFPEMVTQFITLANGVDVTFFGSLAEGINVQHYHPKPSLKAVASTMLARSAIAAASTGAATSATAADPASDSPRPAITGLRKSLSEVHLGDQFHGEDPLLLFVSRISPEKGVHVLIKAFERVHRAFPRCRLRLIGPPGALEPELMLDISDDPIIKSCANYFRGDYLAMLKAEMSPAVKDAVEFLGHVPHDQLPDHYRQASLLVAPSLSEAFGRTPIEAMACGVPVVGARTGGIAETVVPMETGLLVPPNDPDALAEAIIQLLSDPDLRVIMGVKAWQSALNRYSWESIAERTRAYYEQLLSAPVRH